MCVFLKGVAARPGGWGCGWRIGQLEEGVFGVRIPLYPGHGGESSGGGDSG